jgi:hypothetical protein
MLRLLQKPPQILDHFVAPKLVILIFISLGGFLSSKGLWEGPAGN